MTKCLGFTVGMVIEWPIVSAKAICMIFSEGDNIRVIGIYREDVLNTNDFVDVLITRNTIEELLGQLNDGFFENCRVGKIAEL